jgi:protein-disulfide isomerase
MVINSDFECPFCRSFALETFPRVVKEYVAPGKLTVYFQHVPIESLHKNAVGAAVAAECARKQGQFWPMHDAIFSRPDGVQPAQLLEHARRLKLTEPDFRNCTEGDGRGIIADHISNSSRLGIRSTPNFFLGKRITGGSVQVSSVVTGAQPWPTFEREIGLLFR